MSTVRHEVGDKVTVSSFQGTVEKRSAHDGCLQIKDSGGYSHYIYVSQFGHAAPSVTLIESAFKEGVLYEDVYGTTYAYDGDGLTRPFRAVAPAHKAGKRYSRTDIVYPRKLVREKSTS